jgi:4-oxalocrotonate tautomerase
MDERFDEIDAVLTDYFDGLYFSDTARLARAFHPKAHYVCASEGVLLYRTMDEYFPIVDARPSPASRNEPRADRVISIEFAGPRTAFARVECAISPKRFTDFLTLICVNGRWQIISKVFHFEVEADSAA